MNALSNINIYIVWDVDAESWNARPHIHSMHQTIQGAREAIPEFALTYKREPYGKYIENYAYFTIEQRSIGA